MRASNPRRLPQINPEKLCRRATSSPQSLLFTQPHDRQIAGGYPSIARYSSGDDQGADHDEGKGKTSASYPYRRQTAETGEKRSPSPALRTQCNTLPFTPSTNQRGRAEALPRILMQAYQESRPEPMPSRSVKIPRQVPPLSIEIPCGVSGRTSLVAWSLPIRAIKRWRQKLPGSKPRHPPKARFHLLCALLSKSIALLVPVHNPCKRKNSLDVYHRARNQGPT